MKTLCAALASLALLQAGSAALAQEEAPPYENGPVWQVTGIAVQYGHLPEYMQFVATGWKHEQEILKSEHKILDYKVFLNTNPRKGEGDVLLAVLYPNMAALDTTPADDMALIRRAYGSVHSATQGSDQRATFRTVQDTELFREVHLK
jgi:hypothetical protein